MVTPPIPLSAVEDLLSQFHNPSTNNARKREIETALIEFQNNQNTWSSSLYNLSNTSNQYLWFFNVSTVELIIVKKWGSLSTTERREIQKTLWNYYGSLAHNVPKMQREKIAHLIALIGKREFPDDDPAYITHILNLMYTNFNLGISLLRTTSEELVNTREDISSDRKNNFHSAFLLRLNDIFDIIHKIMVHCTSRINTFDISATSEQVFYRQFTEAFPIEVQPFLSSLNELLQCIQHLLSWVPLDDVVTDNLMLQLFDLATYREDCCEISAAALITISELFYRQISLPCAAIIAKGIKNLLEYPDLRKTNELYQDKLTELLKLFTTQHWNQWMSNHDDLHEIITALYHYTFTGYGALAFTERLSIWCPIIRGLATSGFGRYVDIVQLLVLGILRKMQFRFDQDAELDVLDNESLDDDMETEWQHYLRQCIDTIVSIAEGRPFQVFEQVYSDWLRPFEQFMTLEKSHDGHRLTVDDYNKCHLIHCVTRDLTSLCQTLCSLIPVLQADKTVNCSESYVRNLGPDLLPSNLHKMALNLVKAVAFLSRSKLYNLEVSLPQLSSDFAEIYAQILSALRCFLGWSAVRTETELRPLIENVAFTLLPPSNRAQEPKIVTLAAAQLLLSITSTLKPRYALECVSLTQLIQCGSNLAHLDSRAVTYTLQSIVNCFVLPWCNVSNADQDFERRGLLLDEYIGCLAKDLIRLDHTLVNGQLDKIIKITTSVLPYLRDILDHFKEQSTSVKSMLLTAYKPIIFKAVTLYNVFGTTSTEVATCVLNFSLSVIRTLQVQLGSNYVKEMLGIFLEASTREQLTVGRLKAIDILLQMLLLVVEQPGQTTLSLLPVILNLSLNYVTPMLAQERNSSDFCDVAISLYALFDGILHFRWQYFYKSQVLKGFSPNASDDYLATADDDAPQHPEEFLAILTAYGQAIVTGNDPQLTRNVLHSLQSLNERFRLYSRNFFRTNLLKSFQCALIKSLISPEGSLHYDYILSVLFPMGQVSDAYFHESFVSLGYSTNSAMVYEICVAKDLPTFSQKMSQLIQDTRCSQLALSQ
ncbi:hypothetical protein HA402_002153 [Bradysia odoriphaga]|nr:hypothetical protein HA402_002153 [Bradysia odoriphaga]